MPFGLSVSHFNLEPKLPTGRDDDTRLKQAQFQSVVRPPRDLTEPDWPKMAAEMVLTDVSADLGVKFFGPWPEGFNGIASRKKYAMTPEYAKDLKIRVPAMFPMAESVQALGYQTATIDWSEVFTAIQTGVVDGDGANIRRRSLVMSRRPSAKYLSP